jgi:hypothetical protein
MVFGGFKMLRAVFAVIRNIFRGFAPRPTIATRRLEAALRNEEFVAVGGAYKAPRA